MGAGKSEIQNLADDIGRQKVKSDAGKILGQLDAQVVDIFLRGMMVSRKLGEDIGVSRSDRRGIAVGKIDAAVGKPDIVDEADQFGLRNLLANVGFHAIAKRGGFFDARAGGRAHVQLELAAIDAREKILPEQAAAAQMKECKRPKSR